MAESTEEREEMDVVDDSVRDEVEIFISVKTPEDTRKVPVCRTDTVKQVWYVKLARYWGRRRGRVLYWEQRCADTKNWTYVSPSILGHILWVKYIFAPAKNATSYKSKCGTIGKPVCYFLLASNSNFLPILHSSRGQIFRVGTVRYAEGLWRMRSYSALYRFGRLSFPRYRTLSVSFSPVYVVQNRTWPRKQHAIHSTHSRLPIPYTCTHIY